ncbi:unnamed protein product [Leptidea sinapis]|uniref:Riboflavin transporter n=1 Tax=Leptidea sinapis TaxID=189913 RepID=A0A5E4Q640_9NEOP|nr:unnamed protein product [Leptidea sinapis]
MSPEEGHSEGSDGECCVLLDLSGTMSLAVDRLTEEKERTPCLNVENNSQDKMLSSKRRILLDVLFVCWGLGTWLGVNGFFVQLPLLVERLPEGWKLPSSMSVAIQVANVGMLVYAALRKWIPRMTDAVFIYALLAIGTAALFLNAFLYAETVEVGGSQRSVAFLVLTFCVALVGCTSSVLFYPYLRHFRELYLATYLVGEGLSGFIPSILALIQGVGGEPVCVPSADNSTMQAVYPAPLFSSTVFIVVLGFLSTLSLASFTVIHNYSGFSSERVRECEADKEEEASMPAEALLLRKWVGLMLLMAGLNALFNGVMPSVQTYSCRPYGTHAYHLAVTLGAMANPVACLAGVWLRPVRGRVLAAMLSAAGALLVYILVTAAMSPAPPLHSTPGLISYARMWLYGWARRGGARGMRLCGAAGQAGSALGSLLLYVLVNHVHVFHEALPCPEPL